MIYQFENYKSNYPQRENLTERNQSNSEKYNQNENIFYPTYINQYLERENYTSRQRLQNPNINKEKYSMNNSIKKRRIGENIRPLSSERGNINLMNERIITPKTKYNFSYIPIVIHQENPNENTINEEEKEKDKNIIYNSLKYKPQYTNYSSIDPYWKRRGIETQNKIEYMKNQLIEKEKNECRDRPLINKRSIEIAKKNNKDDVFERLNSENFRKKHDEEIQKIAVKNNKNKNPEINKSSQKIKRNIQDLYQWKNKIDTKKQENINNINERLNEERYIKTNKKSQNILNERKPDYINKKVVDRLLEQGKLTKVKKEEEKELYLQNIKGTNHTYNTNINPYLVSDRLFRNGKNSNKNSNNNTLNNEKKAHLRSSSSLNKKKVTNLSFGERIKSEKNIRRNKRCITSNNEDLKNVSKSFKNNSIDLNNKNQNKSLSKINNNQNDNNNNNKSNIENRPNLNWKNNSELIEIRKQLNEFYEMKRHFDENLTEYQKQNYNPPNKIVQKTTLTVSKKEIGQKPLSSFNHFQTKTETQTQYQTFPTEINTISSNYSLKEIKNVEQNNQEKIPVSSLYNNLISENNKIYELRNEMQCNNIPKYNFNFGVLNMTNQENNDYGNIKDQYNLNYDYRSNHFLKYQKDMNSL